MKIIYIFVFFLIKAEIFSQTGYYFVHFTDKQNNEYNISNPSLFLSQRAIQRRINQNLAIDSLDLPVTTTYVNEIKNKGLSIHFTSKWLNGVMVKVDNESLLDTLNNLPFVKKLTYTRPLLSEGTKIRKFENEDKNYIYGMASNQIQMLKGNFIHQKDKLGQGMLIAVLDAGFSGTDTITQFDSLRNDGRIVLTRDFVDGNFDSNVYETHSHGTMVLATMAIIHNGTYVGTAPRAQYALFRTEDGASEYIFEEYCWVAGAELADSIGADLINSSLGYTTFDDPSMNHTWADLDGKTSVASRAATIAARKGIICTISAGNWGGDAWRKIGIPSDADSVISVGAVDSQRNYAFFSSQGYSADGRVKPDVSAQGVSCATVTSAGNYTTASGTSFSSPILCGLVACLWQAFPSKNNIEIMDAVRKSSSQYQNPDSLLGYGIPNFELAYYILTSIYPLNIESFSIKNLYPNPTKNILNIEYQSNKYNVINYELFDIDGKTLKKDIFNILPVEKGVFSINMSNIESGIYLLNINNDDFNKTYLINKFP